MSKRISLRKFIKSFQDGKQIFALAYDMPKEFVDMNLVVREIHMDNLEYNDNWQLIQGDMEAFVEPIDETKPIPEILENV